MEQMESTWRSRLESDIHEGGYLIRGTGVHADQVLDWIAAGATVDEIVAKNPPLTKEDVLACIACAQEALEKQRLLDKIREGVADLDAGKGIPHESVLEHFERKYGYRRDP